MSYKMLLLFTRVYMHTTLAYGFARAITYDYKGSSRYFNGKTGEYEEKEMLLIDNIGRISSSTLAAWCVWPIMLGEDLTRLECAARGKDPAEYKTSRY